MKKFLTYATFTLIIAFVANSFFARGEFKMEKSLLEMVRSFIEDGYLEPPDLSISKVDVSKISNPTENFNYFKYTSDVYLKNVGGNLIRDEVELTNSSQQESISIKNETGGFSIKKGEDFVIEDYEFLLDGNLNFGDVELEIHLKNLTDIDLKNNKFKIEFLEFPAKLKDIQINEIMEDGVFALDFGVEDPIKRKFDFEIYLSMDEISTDLDSEYFEVEDRNSVYGYYRINNSPEVIKDSNFQKKKTSFFSANFLSFEDTFSKKEGGYYFFLKAKDPKDGNYAISDILYFPPQINMNRVDHAKLFVEYAEMPVYEIGANFYYDISDQEWYFPYVQTLYNAGITNTKIDYYFPEQMVTRGEVLKEVIEFFDADLVSRVKKPRFEDIPEDHELYPYAQALYASGKGKYLGENFYPKALATRKFLKYLIYEFKETN